MIQKHRPRFEIGAVLVKVLGDLLLVKIGVATAEGKPERRLGFAAENPKMHITSNGHRFNTAAAGKAGPGGTV